MEDAQPEHTDSLASLNTRPNTSKYPLILGGILLVVVLTGGVYYLSNQKKNNKRDLATPPQQLSVFSTPIPAASMIPSTWQTYTNKELGYAISFPPEFEISQNGGKNSISIIKKNRQVGEGAMNFIYIGVIPDGYQTEGGDIYNYSTKEATILLNMNVGEKRSLREGYSAPTLEEAFAFTRLPDITLGGETAKAYLNTDPWEFPAGVKQYRYFVHKGKNTYMLGGYIEGKESLGTEVITEQEFQEIVSSVTFQ